jgi:hypothetical protein
MMIPRERIMQHTYVRVQKKFHVKEPVAQNRQTLVTSSDFFKHFPAIKESNGREDVSTCHLGKLNVADPVHIGIPLMFNNHSPADLLRDVSGVGYYSTVATATGALQIFDCFSQELGLPAIVIVVDYDEL